MAPTRQLDYMIAYVACSQQPARRAILPER
jgi:hypothetical protein